MMVFRRDGETNKATLRCSDHRSYRGKGMPTGQCVACWRIFERRATLQEVLSEAKRLLKEIV